MTDTERSQYIVETLDRAKEIAGGTDYSLTDVLLVMAIDEIHLLGETVKEEGTSTRSELQSRR